MNGNTSLLPLMNVDYSWFRYIETIENKGDLPMNERKINEIYQLIIIERKKQHKKWGDQNHNDFKWLAILTEEVGELAEAVLHDEFGGKAAGMTEEELLHVAAVAVQWLEKK